MEQKFIINANDDQVLKELNYAKNAYVSAQNEILNKLQDELKKVYKEGKQKITEMWEPMLARLKELNVLPEDFTPEGYDIIMNEDQQMFISKNVDPIKELMNQFSSAINEAKAKTANEPAPAAH